MSVRAGVAAHDVAVAVEEYATVGRSINTSSAATTAKVKAMAAAKVMATNKCFCFLSSATFHKF